MKTIFYIIVYTLFLLSCKEDKQAAKQQENLQNTTQETIAYPLIKFDKKEHDFGQMKQGDELETTFNFQNVGQGVLQITSIKAKCGCTVPNDWPDGPILPGAEGSFTVKFNSRSKKGRIKQPITITANTRDQKDVVTITADVSVE